MSRWFSGSSIAVSFSTRGALMPAWMVQHVAATASVHGVDVDATSAVGAWLATCGTPEKPQVPVRSVWLPPEGLRAPKNRRLIEMITDRQPDSPPLAIVLLPGSFTLRELARTFDAVRASSPLWPVAIGLPSAALKGGRPHLVQLSGIRRFAEEWELPVAVDLSGRFDPTWEAEAAVARLGEKLSVLRLSAAAPSAAAIGRDRVACRALHAAIDRARLLDVAISPVRQVPFAITPRAAANAAQRAAEYVAGRAAYHAAALREGIDRFEGSRTSRGI